MVDLTKVKGPGSWLKMRREVETVVSTVLGKLPENKMDLQLKIADEVEFEGYTRRRINYFVDEWSRISAWLFIPEGKEERPALVCCHGATAEGKDEPAGLSGSPSLAHARRYAEKGFVTIAPDSITTGERRPAGLEPLDTRNFYKDYPNMSAVGKMLVDHMRSIDTLSEMREVDPARIGVIGHGLGATNALFLSAFDERIQACVSSCGFTSFLEDDAPSRWAADTGLVLLPALKEAIASGDFPFDWDHVLALMAPIPALLISAKNDKILSNTKSCEKLAKRAAKIYKLLGAASAIETLSHKGGHDMNQEALDAADDWLERWL